MIFGLDYLLACNYTKSDVDLCVKTFPKGFALGVFSTLPEGGDARPFVEKIIKTGRCPKVRIHLMWKDDHNFSKSDFPKIVAEAKKWEPLIKKYWNTSILTLPISFDISPACEHNLNAKDAAELKKQIYRVLGKYPNMFYVNTPLAGHGALLPYGDSRNELHGSIGNTVNPFNFSFDGTSAVDSDVQTLKDKAVKQKCDTFFMWIPQFNLRKNTNDKTPRPQRKVTLSKELIESVIFLATDKGKTALSDKYLYKSHAEQTMDNTALDKRGNHPVIIVPEKFASLQLKDSKGKVVAIAKYYGPYTGGGYRYYISSYGYKIAKEVLTLTGGSKVYGKVNPAFRAGKFR